MARAVDVATAVRGCFQNDPGITKVHKLLYYCQAWHVTWTGQPLFDERIEAWDNGPVVADLWRGERYGFAEEASDELEPDAMKTVRYVVKRYGRRWATQLVGDTHAEAPWREAYARGRNSVIRVDELREFFSRDPAADQAWFWDEDWQAGEREADRDIREGRLAGAMTEDEFLSSL